MMKRSNYIPIGILLLAALQFFVFSNKDTQSESIGEATVTKYVFIDTIDDNGLPILSQKDIALARKSNFDTVILAQLRKHTNVEFRPLVYVNPSIPNAKPDTLYHVISFIVHELTSKSMEVVYKFNEHFYKKNYLLFYDENVGNICVTKVTDQYDIMRLFETNADNYRMGTEKVISTIKNLDEKYNLNLLLLSAGLDVCSFKVRNELVDWHNLAKDCYAFCPDIVTQGTGTVAELEKELKSNGELYFWWD